MPRELVASSMGALGSGNFYAALAVARSTKTFTEITFATGTTAPAGTYTDFRAGVTDINGNMLQQTANAVGTVVAASTIYTLPLLAPLTLTQDEEVYVGIACIATTMPTIRGIATLLGIMALTPILGVDGIGALVTGNPITNPGTPTGSSALPWCELN